MWSYYGAKTNVVGLYPPPKYGKIIEPFAGSAQYALKYFDREVLLVDKYDVIIKIWKWLQICSVGDIMKLPRLKTGDRLDSFSFDCEEARLLMSFMMGFSTPSPRFQATSKHTERPNYTEFNLKKIANNLPKIRHWEIRLGTFADIENEPATWFIDPPYQNAGKGYVHNSTGIDFKELALWCMARKGQTIVCDCAGANWLKFIPLASQRTKRGWQHEVFWTNEETSYSTTQSEIIFQP